MAVMPEDVRLWRGNRPVHAAVLRCGQVFDDAHSLLRRIDELAIVPHHGCKLFVAGEPFITLVAF